jgi:signal transduction histidine kinase
VLPLRQLAAETSNTINNEWKNIYKLEEVNTLAGVFKKAFEDLKSLQAKEVHYALKDQISELAQQVSHDIRSPLAALEMVIPSVSELPEEKRLIIRNSINRIRDIANSLLSKKPGNHLQDNQTIMQIETAEQKIKKLYLLPLIEEIITEKRLQYRENLGLTLEFLYSADTYAMFVCVDPTELKRILSNLINNAYESLIDNKGIVHISISTYELNHVAINIVDNGAGIPDHLIEKIGIRGETFGKVNGTGLGIYHAIESLKAWGGKIHFKSSCAPKENHGTTVTITLPRADSPSWFVPQIKVQHSQHVVIFDDDQTIHQIWKDRFDPICKTNSSVNLHHISTVNAFRNFFRNHFTDQDESIYLMDYEIVGTNETGLDLIEQCGIQQQAILVTSRYEDALIQERCQKLSVKLIPKMMSAFIPIHQT